MSLKTVTIAEIAAPDKRSIAIGPFGSSLKADLYVPSGVPVVRGQNIKEGGELDESDLVFVEPETAARFPACLLNEGDLVFPHRGAIGRVGIVGKRQMLLSSSMMKLTVDPLKADPRFVFYYFRGPGQNELLMRASTVGTPGIGQPLTSLRGIPIQIPELDQQRAIAEVLSALDDKIAANKKLVQVADDLGASLTRNALDSSESIALSTIADIVMGSSPLGTSFNEVGEGTVFYQGVRDFGFRFPCNRVWTTAAAKLARSGDTLLSVRAPVGRVNLATEKTCIGRGVASVRSSSGRPFTLFHILKDSHEAWAPFEAEGTVFGSINKGQLASLRVPRLKPEYEDQLEAMLAPMERVIGSALRENTNLAATRDALLPQLMSGKLRVQDAEKVLEGTAA